MLRRDAVFSSFISHSTVAVLRDIAIRISSAENPELSKVPLLYTWRMNKALCASSAASFFLLDFSVQNSLSFIFCCCSSSNIKSLSDEFWLLRYMPFTGLVTGRLNDTISVSPSFFSLSVTLCLPVSLALSLSVCLSASPSVIFPLSIIPSGAYRVKQWIPLNHRDILLQSCDGPTADFYIIREIIVCTSPRYLPSIRLLRAFRDKDCLRVCNQIEDC